MAIAEMALSLALIGGGVSVHKTVVRVPPKIVALTCPLPTYPAWSRQRREEGKVVLFAKVDENGLVREATLAEPCRHPALHRAAREAVLRWKMQPATRNGFPVADTIRIPFVFHLQQSK